MPAGDQRYLVTGALGCIGAWTVRALARREIPVVAFDLATNTRRLELVASPDELRRVTLVKGDITDLASIERAIDEHGITNVIHLAALQIPFCRADPPLGRPGERRRDGQRVRSGPAPRRPDGPGRVHGLDRDVRRGRRRPLERPAGERRGPPPDEPLRRLQAGQRGHGPDLLGRPRPLEHRPAPVHGVRTGSRPGPDEHADQGDRRGDPRPAVHGHVRWADRVPVRRGRRRRRSSSPAGASSAAPMPSISAAAWPTSASSWPRSMPPSRERPGGSTSSSRGCRSPRTSPPTPSRPSDRSR